MKRFLVGLMSVTLAAGAVFGMSRGSPSIVTASPSAQTSTTQSTLPGGPRQNDGTRAGGQIASVSGNTVTVKNRDGASQSIVTSDSTTVTLDGSASNVSALAAGQFIRATGTTDSAGAFTATSIEANTTPPQGGPGGPGGPGGSRQNDGTRAGGQVASVSGNTVTVKNRDGASQSIVASDSTTVTLDGSASNVSALAAGQFIRATGTTDSAGAFTATSIEGSTTQPQGRPGGPRP